MQIISDLEPEGRGAYAGAIGYFGYGGAVETAITIRTAVLKDGVAHVQAGAGIVADSDPAAEHRECQTKAQALPVKLALPLGFFVFPTMLIVIMLPVAIRIYRVILER